MAFVALETGLKINRFSELPGGTPEFRTRTSGTLKCFFPGAVEDHELRERTSRVLESLFPGVVEDHLLCLMIHFNKT